MAPLRLSSVAWKWLIYSLAGIIALLIAIDCGYALLARGSGQAGDLGITLHDPIGANQSGLGTHHLQIQDVKQGSSAALAGVPNQGYLKFKNYQDRWRRFAPNEKVSVFLAGKPNAVPISAQPSSLSSADQWDYWTRCLLAALALGAGMLIASKSAHRSLSLGFILLSLIFFYPFNFMPAGFLFGVCKLAVFTAYPWIYYCLTHFVLSYKHSPNDLLRGTLMATMPAYLLFTLVASALSAGFALGYEAPILWWLIPAVVIWGMVMTFASLIDGLVRSRGDTRKRHVFLLAAFAFSTLPALATTFEALDIFALSNESAQMRWTVVLTFVGELFMFGLLTYAVLVHQIFDFRIGPSIGAFSVVSTIILCFIFAVEEWGDKKFGPEHDLLIALVTYLLFHFAYEKIKHQLHDWWFAAWIEKDKQLRAFVRRSSSITSPDALLNQFCQAVDQYTDSEGCAIYVCHPDGNFRLAKGSLEAVPAALDVDDCVAVALRAESAPFRIEPAHACAKGAYAFPLCRHNGVLTGFLLLGRRGDGEPYRREEIDTLAECVNLLGLELHTREADRLARHLDEVQHEVSRLMAGRRHAPEKLHSLTGVHS